MAQVRCVWCKNVGTLPDSHMGKRIKCRKCGQAFLSSPYVPTVRPGRKKAIAIVCGLLSVPLFVFLALSSSKEQGGKKEVQAQRTNEKETEEQKSPIEKWARDMGKKEVQAQRTNEKETEEQKSPIEKWARDMGKKELTKEEREWEERQEKIRKLDEMERQEKKTKFFAEVATTRKNLESKYGKVWTKPEIEKEFQLFFGETGNLDSMVNDKDYHSYWNVPVRRLIDGKKGFIIQRVFNEIEFPYVENRNSLFFSLKLEGGAK